MVAVAVAGDRQRVDREHLIAGRGQCRHPVWGSDRGPQQVRRPERGDPGLWRRSLVQPPLTDADESHCTDALRAQTAGATTRDRTTTTPPVTRAHECLITCDQDAGSGRPDDGFGTAVAAVQ
jgi:hypothetical protein